MFCQNCGQILNDDASFCFSCGKPVRNNPDTGTTPVSPFPSAPGQPLTPPVPRFPQNQTAASAPAQQKPQSNSALIMIIAILTLMVLVSMFLLFIKPGYLRNSKKGNNSIIAEESQTTKRTTSRSTAPKTTETTASETAENAETTATDALVMEGDPALRNALQQFAALFDGRGESVPEGDVPETEAIPNNEEPPPSEESRIGGPNRALDEAWAASTGERPDFSEFEWCFGQFGLVYQPPENADMITDPDGTNGGWKAMIIYNPTNSANTFTRELDNIYISVDGGAVQLTIDWYLMAPDYSEAFNEEDMPDTVFNGTVTSSGIHVTGAADIAIDTFWNSNGKQYAIGILTTQDGIPAYLAMVRP